MRQPINWKAWRRGWLVQVWTYLLVIRTPWFLIGLSTGDRDIYTGLRWYGIRAYWNHAPGWRVQPGESMFRSKDEFLSWTEPRSDSRGAR